MVHFFLSESVRMKDFAICRNGIGIGIGRELKFGNCFMKPSASLNFTRKTCFSTYRQSEERLFLDL